MCSVYSHQLDEITGDDWDQVDKIFTDNKTLHDIPLVCDRLLACLEQLQCDEAQSKFHFYEKKCGKLEFRNNEMSSCISSVYEEIHYRNDSCTNDFDYFSLYFPIKNESYIHGKSCFMKIVNSHCSEKAITWLEDNYDKKFLKLLTTPPNDGECTSLHQELLGRQCEPECIEQGKVPENCRKLKNCFEGTDCTVVKENMIDEECDQLNYRNFDLTHCMKKFYRQLYEGESSCSGDYLSRNMTIKLEAFTSGKSCFMDFVETYCSTRVLPYLTSSYEEFLEVLTVPATTNQSCVSLRDQLITAECSVFETRLSEEIEALQTTKTLRATCKDMEECLNQSPYISAGNDLDEYKKRCHNEISLNCYAGIKCTESQEQKIIYDQKCEKLYFDNQNITKCIFYFYDAVYQENPTCVKEFNYFSKDMRIRRGAYTSGKSCLMDFAKKNCAASAIEYLNSDYERLLEVMTTPTDEEKCDSLHDELMAKQCEPEVKNATLDIMLAKMNSMQGLPIDNAMMLKKCESMKQCLSDYCYYNSTVINTIDELCDLVNSRGTTFNTCFAKISTDVDVTKYECIDYTPSKTPMGSAIATAKMLEFLKDKSCVKTVMKGECDPRALEILMKDGRSGRRRGKNKDDVAKGLR
ncbi:hypothetical protein CAEBREN_14060 [Caenorhabditis brenneri]|uniref:T20D4.11-like domain-containing protein n=1 Tax=Caenorhabditis brenneri TaxID=135651 RepID=G0M9X8_CAEBE|nr:hypothetical protein CAEBREN_14060 [Caenorhabditis brenneri]